MKDSLSDIGLNILILTSQMVFIKKCLKLLMKKLESSHELKLIDTLRLKDEKE
jgi:hypothetical protein